MLIKTSEGNYNVASNAKTNTALGLGIAGLATSLLGGGANMWANNSYNRGMSNSNDPESTFITRHELDLVQQIINKDAELAIAKSENYTDKKLVEVTAYVDGKINRLADKVDANFRQQQDVNAQQMAYNAAANANIDVLKSQVAALTAVTKVYIPSSNVCQSSCACGCGCASA